MAEARTGDLSMAAGRWRLRLIGSHSPLPFLSREAVSILKLSFGNLNSTSIIASHRDVFQEHTGPLLEAYYFHLN